MGFFGSKQNTTDPALKAQLDRIEAKLDIILEQFGLAVAPTGSAAAARQAKLGGALPPGVEDLWRRGDKIGAIKAFREATNSGLKEAKDTLEEWAKANGVE